ncbi:hypothetical protein IMY05_012G0056200 [Salix suchowensis]|nr:hypothetical protein IMY05_012G0056200 [Salix suchowensis]
MAQMMALKVGKSKVLEKLWTLNAFDGAALSVDEQTRSPFSFILDNRGARASLRISPLNLQVLKSVSTEITHTTTE